MNLVFIQSCNSNRVFYHYVHALLQQHHVVLRVVKKLWNDEINTPRTSPHNQWFHQIFNFWSILREESLESQQKHALRNNFCERYCVQMTF